MRRMLSQLWKDDGGAIIAIEFLFFVVIIVLGLVVGFVAVRNGVVDELTALANAVDGLGICFSFAGLSNCESSVCGTNVTVSSASIQIQTFKTAATNVVSVTHNPCQ